MVKWLHYILLDKILISGHKCSQEIIWPALCQSTRGSIKIFSQTASTLAGLAPSSSGFDSRLSKQICCMPAKSFLNCMHESSSCAGLFALFLPLLISYNRGGRIFFASFSAYRMTPLFYACLETPFPFTQNPQNRLSQKKAGKVDHRVLMQACCYSPPPLRSQV